jgi:hypothetical protein
MFQSWRMKLREAEAALKLGRLDEAGRLLSEGNLREFLPGQQLAAKVAIGMTQRALQQAESGNAAAAWRDLETAKSLGGETEDVRAARQQLVDRTLAEAENYLEADDPANALSRLEQLENRGVVGESLSTLKQIARRMESARNLCRRGKFAEADAQLAAAAALRPDLPVIQQRRDECQEKLRRGRELTEQLHRAMGAAQWSKALALADQLLDLAPDERVARYARQRAWSNVGARMPESRRLALTQYWTPSHVASELAADSASGAATCTAEAEPVTRQQIKSRFLLWVDAVGGYLVCLNSEITIGQATPGNGVDVPIQADLSRRHATIRRQGESYVIEPLGRVRVEGKMIESTTLLSDGDEIELGSGVCLRFRKSHALSASARLDFVSRHRPQPYADAVLLMAESCVLGPKWHNHVVCRDWPDDVVLYRQDDDLYCRSMQPLEIDGLLCDGRGRITQSSRVTGDDFSMSLEELDK